VPLVKSLLASGASPKAELNGDHLLILAAGANCPEAVTILLQRGLNVNLPAEDGTTALMRAAQEGYVDMVKLLLARGADMELKDKENQSAWLFAASGNHTDVIELLRANRDARQRKKQP
jgi:ankyrin repeat protein